MRRFQAEAVKAVVKRIGEQERILLSLPVGSGYPTVILGIIQHLPQSASVAILVGSRAQQEQFQKKFQHHTELRNARIEIILFRKSSVAKPDRKPGSKPDGESGNQSGGEPENDYDVLIVPHCEQVPLAEIGANYSYRTMIGIDSITKRSQAYFGAPVYTYSIGEAILDGFLVDFQLEEVMDVVIPSHPFTAKNCEEAAHSVLERAQGEKSLVLCRDVADAECLSDLLNRQQPGCAVTLFAKMYPSVRSRIIEKFRNPDSPWILIAVSMLPDIPEIRNVFLLRFIAKEPEELRQYLSRYLQHAPGKRFLQVFDYPLYTIEPPLSTPFRPLDPESPAASEETPAPGAAEGAAAEKPAAAAKQSAAAEGPDATGATETSAASGPARLRATPIIYRDRDSFRPVMGVRDIAEELADSILRIRPEQGCMIGIFGQWGRGKTFLFEETMRVLQDREPVERVDFHAWKYQKTPASWAYLYEQFAQAYYGGARNRFGHFWRPLRLNFIRLGWSKALFFLGSVAASLLLLQVPLADKLSWAMNAAAFLGVSLLGLVFFCIRHKHPAISLFREYYGKLSYVKVLGIQAEIQKELRHLIRAWRRTAESRRGTPLKIVLFVDDMDRCDEEKLVQLADSLRVMLDDRELSRHIVVVTAVDDRLLKRAICRKYAQGNLEAAELCTLTSEYMDKLFLAGIRLGALSEAEKEELFDELVRQDTAAAETGALPGQPAATPPALSTATPGQPEKRTGEHLGTTFPADVGEGDAPAFGSDDGFEAEGPDEEPAAERAKAATTKPTTAKAATAESATDGARLTGQEIGLFKEELHALGGVTPRRMRIYYYRYLTAKNLLIRLYKKSGRPCPWLADDAYPIFLRLLTRLSTGDARESIDRETEAMAKAPEGPYTMQCIDAPAVDREELRNLLHVLDIVIGY